MKDAHVASIHCRPCLENPLEIIDRMNEWKVMKGYSIFRASIKKWARNVPNYSNTWNLGSGIYVYFLNYFCICI